jgi:hypothetical protein
LAWLCLIHVLSAPLIAHAAGLVDGFESEKLDDEKWFLRDVQGEQVDFADLHRCGKKSVKITVRDGDGGANCGECQRAEVRDRASYRPPIDREAWYGFSFRVVGQIPRLHRVRHVIGQWKSPNDTSPFIAQRIDKGVFHITTEDNGVRRVIAKSTGNLYRLDTLQEQLSQLDSKNELDVAAVTGLQDIAEARQIMSELNRNNSSLSRLFSQTPFDPRFDKRLDTDDETETMADLMDELTFASEIEKYVGKADIIVTPEAESLLPDPKEGWVDMVYRIKPGRTDNLYGPKGTGEIDIWANGKQVASVRGNLGNRITKPPEQKSVYFKFGIYRDYTPGELSFLFDEYKQGSSFAEVTVDCR